MLKFKLLNTTFYCIILLFSGSLLVKLGHECNSKDQQIGVFPHFKDCELACRNKKGCKFFLYGNHKNSNGVCFWETTASENCPERWRSNVYDFYMQFGLWNCNKPNYK